MRLRGGLDRYVGPGGDDVVRHARRPARRDRAIPRAALSQGPRRGARAIAAGADQPERADLPDDRLLQPARHRAYFKLGRKIAFFGDGYQFRDVRFGRKVWVVPILGGEFVIDRRFGYRDGLMGGNLWFMGATSTRPCWPPSGRQAAAQPTPGVITPFPGGIAASGSKAGSRYSFSIASTYAEFCPTLRDKLGEQSQGPAGRRLDHGDHHQRPRPGRRSPRPRRPPSPPRVDTPGLVKISAGNYGGRLGKSFIYLHPDKQPA